MDVKSTQILLLKELINAFRYKSLYLLGAGVSYEYIPPEYRLYEIAKQELAQYISGVPLKEIPDLRLEEIDRFEINIGQRIIHPTSGGQLLIDDTYLDFNAFAIRIHPEILELFALLNYSLESHPICCPEYQIFNYTNQKSIFLNLNHDNLAEKFIKKRKLISLHGSLPPQARKIISENLTHYLEFGSHLQSIKKIINNYFYLATKEYEHLLLHTHPYAALQQELIKNKFFNIMIIGFSFFRKNSHDIYDGLTYDFIRSYICDNKKCRIVIIDPEPNFVADILSKNISNIRIYRYKTYWNCFTKAVFLYVLSKAFT